MKEIQFCFKCKGFIPDGAFSRCKFTEKNKIDGEYRFCMVSRGEFESTCCRYQKELNIIKLIWNNIFK